MDGSEALEVLLDQVFEDICCFSVGDHVLAVWVFDIPQGEPFRQRGISFFQRLENIGIQHDDAVETIDRDVGYTFCFMLGNVDVMQFMEDCDSIWGCTVQYGSQTSTFDPDLFSQNEFGQSFGHGTAARIPVTYKKKTRGLLVL